MNNDYISREAVIVELCNILCGVDPQECQLQIPHDGAEHCTTIGAILAIPAADVVPRDWHNRCMEIEIQNRIAADVRPVMHGEWINKKTVFVTYGSAECSACGERTSGSKVDTGWGVEFEYPNFCPNCGADMREADHEPIHSRP